MEPDEVVHNTAPILLLQVAETHGPAAGEGILLVTSNALVWGPEDAELMARVEQQAAEQVREGRSAGASSVPTQGLGFAGFRWPKPEIREFTERRCPRAWHGISTGFSRWQRRQMRLLHLEVGTKQIDLVGGVLLIDDVVRYLQGETPSVAVIGRRVIWGDDGETGAVLSVVKNADGKLVGTTAAPHPARNFEPDDPDLESSNALANQALGELLVSFGIEPGGGYEWPRPAWMPEFRWDPPLPVSGTDA